MRDRVWVLGRQSASSRNGNPPEEVVAHDHDRHIKCREHTKAESDNTIELRMVGGGDVSVGIGVGVGLSVGIGVSIDAGIGAVIGVAIGVPIGISTIVGVGIGVGVVGG